MMRRIALPFLSVLLVVSIAGAASPAPPAKGGAPENYFFSLKDQGDTASQKKSCPTGDCGVSQSGIPGGSVTTPVAASPAAPPTLAPGPLPSGSTPAAQEAIKAQQAKKSRPAAPPVPVPGGAGAKAGAPVDVMDELGYDAHLLQDLGKHSQIQRALPDMPTAVFLSSSETNRISCDSPIKDVIHSTEKGLMVRYSGKDAFFKFRVLTDGTSAKYAKAPVEAYVICGDRTFPLIAIPQALPAQHVKLSTGPEKAKKNMAVFQGMSIERKCLRIIQEVDSQDIPDSYTVIEKGADVDIFKDMTIRHLRDVVVEGEGLRLKEFAVRHSQSADIECVEKEFLKPKLSMKAIAISCEEPVLKSGRTTRLYIVEPVNANDGGKPGHRD